MEAAAFPHLAEEADREETVERVADVIASLRGEQPEAPDNTAALAQLRTLGERNAAEDAARGITSGA